MIKHPYTYLTLRYVHDVVTGEFVNVGLVLHMPVTGSLIVKVISSIRRLRCVFPALEKEDFLAGIRSVQSGLLSLKQSKTLIDSTERDVGALARQVLPADDSALQWSTVSSGISESAEIAFDKLYRRLITKYDSLQIQRRSDEDIWRPVRNKLEERNISQYLSAKTISGSVDGITFKHAWKNGVWHVYEPISLDLASDDNIRTKAREWLGHLSAVAADTESEPFKPHFLVGAPAEHSLLPAYKSAIAILRQAPNGPEVFEEAEADDLVSQIEDEVRYHRN